MKLYVTLLHAVALLSLAGSTWGNDVTPTGCTVTLDPEHGMHRQVNELAFHCLGIDQAKMDELYATHTLEDYKTYIKNRCDKKQEVLECLTGVSHTSEVCDTEMGHKFFLIFHDLLETIVDSVCVQDGGLLASILMTYNTSHAVHFKSDHFHDCIDTVGERMVRLMDKNIEPHSRYFILYRELVNSGECFGDIHEGDVTLTKAIEHLLGDVVDKIKCMHPQEETAVLCKAIDINLPEVPKICPMKSLDEENHSLKDDLLEGMSWCLSSFFDYPSVRAIDTLESSWEFFVHNCKKRKAISKCVSEIVTLSSVCLNEEHQNVVKLANDVIQHGLDYLCIVDGGYPAGYVVYKALSKTGATPGHNDIKECFALAHPHHVGHIEATDFLKFYKELHVFHLCLMGKMHGDNRAVFDVHLFLSSVARSMKCLDPEHGTMVLCESMVAPTNSTEEDTCPFVGGHENESPKYDRFLDLAILCLKTAAVALDPVKLFTKLEQYETFFKSFCHNRNAVKMCLLDVTEMSEVCADPTHHKMLSIFTDLYGNAVESGCKEDGEVFATMLNGMWADAEHGIAFDVLQTCMNVTGEQYNSHVMDVSQKTSVINYQLFLSLGQCILNGASEDVAFKTKFSTFTNELSSNFKCIHPDDGTLVLCTSFVN